MNIYIGNLSYEVTEVDLKHAFETFGQVKSSKVIKDMQTGVSKGFGFVQMPVKKEAWAAIEGLDGTDLKGRNMRVDRARPRTQGRRGPLRQGLGSSFF